MKRLTIAAAGLATVVHPVLASAAPGDEDPTAADVGRMAAATIALDLPQGETGALQLRALAGAGGDRLLASLVRCDDDGCLTRRFSGALPADALTIDPAAADAALRLTIDGTPMSLTWRPSDRSAVLLGGFDGGGSGGSFEASIYDGSPAEVNLRFAATSCAGEGAVGEAVAVDTSGVTGTRAARPLGSLRLPAGAEMRC